MAEGDSISAALARGSAQLRGQATGRRDAELLLMHAIGCDRAYLFAHPDTRLRPEQAATFESWLARRAGNEPVQYIIGAQEFYGLRFRVTRDVLIPRPETEHLVEAALARADREARLRIVDVGTGSGAIAVALAHALPNSCVIAVDVSPSALDVALENAELHGVAQRMEFVQSDLLVTIADERFEMVVSNPPYVAENEQLEVQVRDFEPSLALYGGPEGLDVYRRLIPQARTALKSGGWLLMELGHGQQDGLTQMLASWKDVSFVNDLQGISRVICARRP
jgi:release factor glutamine methyltransferase